MKRISIRDFELRILTAALAAHPYRDAVLGDLSEERLNIEAAEGTEGAHRWYRDQVRRSVFPILSNYPVAPGLALCLMALVVTVYLSAVRASNFAGFEIEHMLARSRGIAFVALYLVAIAIAGGVGGFVVSVVARRHAFLAALFMLAVICAVGVIHVVSAVPPEVWFRLWKVSVFILAVAVGVSLGASAAPSPDRRQ